MPDSPAPPPLNAAPVASAARSKAAAKQRSALSLAALASVAVPGLNPARLTTPQNSSPELRQIGVVDTAGRTWEVLEPQDDTTGASLEAEAGVLRAIGRVADDGRVSFQVARVAGSVRTGGTHVQVRTYLPGSPIDLRRLHPGPGLSSGLGRALGELHELPVSVINEAGLPSYSAQEVRQRWVQLLDEAEKTGQLPEQLVRRWRQALRHPALWRFRPVVVHGDLAEENVLVAGGGVVGIRGLSQAHVGDPAEDLAWVYASVPLECLDSIENGYDIARSEGVDKHLRDRAELVSELGLARWLLHGVRSQDETVVEDAVAMLADLLEQVGDEPLVEEIEVHLAPVCSTRVTSPDDTTLDVAMVGVEQPEEPAPAPQRDGEVTETLSQVPPSGRQAPVPQHQPVFSQAPATVQLSVVPAAPTGAMDLQKEKEPQDALGRLGVSGNGQTRRAGSRVLGAGGPGDGAVTEPVGVPVPPASGGDGLRSRPSARPGAGTRSRLGQAATPLADSTLGLIDDLSDEDILTS